MSVVVSLISVSLFTDMHFQLCFSFVNHSVVDMLRVCYSVSFSATGFSFFRQAILSPPFFLHSRAHSFSRPLGMQRRHSWWFFLFFSCKLRYSVISDLAFSGFRRKSHRSPRSLTAMFGYDKSHRTQRRLTFFCLPLRHPNSRRAFHLRQPRFVILAADSSLSLPSPHPPSIFNNIYI